VNFALNTAWHQGHLSWGWRRHVEDGWSSRECCNIGLGMSYISFPWIYSSSFALQFESINERINCILTRGNTRVIYNYCISYPRASLSLREEALH